MIDTILSTLSRAPVGDFVYSSFGFYAPQWDWEIPGPWFVRALNPLGPRETAIRQTLFRMEQAGVLETRREGRMKWYRPSVATRAIVEAGTARILNLEESSWDGCWTLVQLRFDVNSRRSRDQVRDLLRMEGFGSLGGGLYVHARDRTARLRSILKGQRYGDRLVVMRGLLENPSLQRLVQEAWDLPALATRYRKIVRRYRSLAEGQGRWEPRRAAAVRFALAFDLVRLSWEDPELPPDLVPPGWPAGEARTFGARLYRRLAPAAAAYGDSVLKQIRQIGAEGEPSAE